MKSLEEERKKGKKKGGVLKSKFKLKRDSKEAREKMAKLSRKEKKKLIKEHERLSKLSQRELHAHMMMKDPNNPFIRKLTMEGP